MTEKFRDLDHRQLRQEFFCEFPENYEIHENILHMTISCFTVHKALHMSAHCCILLFARDKPTFKGASLLERLTKS